MKDLFSKIAFGFIMAQFVPGVVLLFSLCLAYKTLVQCPPNSILSTLKMIADFWADSFPKQATFVALATASGMAIHGLHWAVLGFLEKDKQSVAASSWHKRRIVVQIFLAPIQIVWEIAGFLITGKSIKEVAIEENVPKIPKERMNQLDNVQGFYLSFSQFYAHTSYALLMAFCTVVVFMLDNGASLKRITFTLLLYCMCGFFFIISRVQLQALFKAENDLTKVG